MFTLCKPLAIQAEALVITTKDQLINPTADNLMENFKKMFNARVMKTYCVPFRLC